MKCSRAGIQWSLVTLASIAVAACDPCAGTSACRTSDRVAYTGHVVERATGRSVSGARVTFTRTAGVELFADTIAAMSGSDGFFSIEANAKSEGLVVGTLHVSPPGRAAYDMAGIELRTTRTGGDGGDLGRIVSDPYIVFIGQVRNRLTGDEFAGQYAAIGFQRTGGIAIEPDTITTQADLYGRFSLTPRALTPGIVEGRLTVRIEGRGRFVMPIRIETRYRDEAVRDVAVINWGSALLWVGEVYRRATNQHVAGIQVDFQRTGGIDVTPPQFTTFTDAIGYFPIQPAPAGDGELVGTVTIHPPGGAPFSVPNVRVRTMGDDTVRFAGRFGYGTQAYGLLDLRYRTTQSAVAPGTIVSFRRISGVETFSPTFVDTVKEHGFAGVQLATNIVGAAVGDIEVKLGEPYGTDTLRGVSIPSVDSDTERFVGTFITGRWFPLIAQVLDSATHKAIPGATVSFTRVAGIDFTPNPYTVVPDANGIFPLRPQPLTDGDVVGNLTFQLPAPYPSTLTIQGIHLRSSMNDTLHFLGTWFVGPKK